MSKQNKWMIAGAAVVFVACAVAICCILARQHRNQLNMEALQDSAHLLPSVDTTTVATEEPAVIPINFEEIRKENEDIVAWVEVPGTDVDYPILQSKPEMEEDFYLEHNLDGSGGYPGCIYIQKSNSADFCDAVTVVYGHNMKNGSMFSSLHRYEDRDFFDEHPNFSIYTPTEAKTYRVIAALNYDDRLIPAYFHFFLSGNDVGEFLKDIYGIGEGERSHFVEDAGIEPSDHYVVLSTCSSNSADRWLVVGIWDKDL